MSDLEDDFEEGGGRQAHLNEQIFGSDDDDDQQDYVVEQHHHQQQHILEDEEENLEDDLGPGPAAAPSPAPAAPAARGGLSEVEERKARLAQLARKKRSGGDDDDEGDQPKKKKKKKAAADGEGGGKDKEKGRKKKAAGEKGDKPPARRAAAGGRGAAKGAPAAGGRAAAEGRGAAAGEALGEEGEDGEEGEELVPNAEDDNFIDDEGVQPVSEDADEGAELGPPPEEAEEGEEDDVDRALKAGKRKKHKDSEQQMQAVVDDLLAAMEAAAEDDFEVVARNCGKELAKDGANFKRDSHGGIVVARTYPPPAQPLPAVRKLQMLTDVENLISQRKFHELFIQAGGLGVLKSWLEPYIDNSLPNVKVRNVVLRCCKLLPVDTRREDIKESLKKSQLGVRVMFLYKCPDETAANRQLAKELVHEWSRHIFYDPEAEAEKRKVREMQLAEARRASVLEQRSKASEPEPKKRPMEVARIHAAIPQASKLDYVVNPQAAPGLKEQAGAGPKVAKATDSVFMRKIREAQRKTKMLTQRTKPSTEGRSLVLMDT